MARTKSINFPNTESEMSAPFDRLQRAVTNVLLSSGGLAIHGTSSALAKFANTLWYMADGVLCTKATADCAALSGTVTNGKYNVFVFTVQADGTLSTHMGTEASAATGIVFPTIPDGEVVIGFVEIHPSGTGDFVGGTTNLDDATVVPNAVYVNTPCVVAPFCNPL